MVGKLSMVVLACLQAVALVSVGASEAKFLSLEELDRLPEGIKIVHEPKTALATLTGKSERRAKYTWFYKTTVSAIEEDVTITEFGAFVWIEGKWVIGGSFTGKPYGSKEFEEWYKCPRAVLKNGESYSDPINWSSAAELQPGKHRWYFVGIDAQGKKVKGEAIVELKAEINPAMPKDPE